MVMRMSRRQMIYTIYHASANRAPRYKRYVRENKGPLVKYNHRIKLMEDIGIDLDPCNVL